MSTGHHVPSQLILAVLCVAIWATCCQAEPRSVDSPDAAVAAAKSGFQGVYDKASWHSELSPEAVAKFEPYNATLSNGWWDVVGTAPAGYQGHVPRARVSQGDGRVEVSVP